MKKTITFLLSMSIVLFWNSEPLRAQGKSAGHGPSVNSGHGQAGSHSNSHTSSTTTTSAGQTGGHAGKSTWQTRFTDRLQSDPAFQTRIQALLPKGTDPAAAAAGFKNTGQFIAAMHVSKNLNIPFDQLKAKMTGVAATSTTQTSTTQTSTTQTSPMSLGKAIQELKPALTQTQANEEAKKAATQATTTQKTGSTT
jgi:hypothetical protein